MDYHAYNEALKEMQHVNTEYFVGDATESMQGDMNALAKKYNPQLMDLSAKFGAAMKIEEYDAALKFLNQLDGVVKGWKHDLDALEPDESKMPTYAREVAKVASIIIAVIVLIKTPAIARFIGKTLYTKGVFKKPGATLANMGAQMILGTQSFGVAYRGIAGLMMRRVSREEKAKYANDPRAYNKNYVAAQVQLDRWISGLTLAKTELQKLKSGAMQPASEAYTEIVQDLIEMDAKIANEIAITKTAKRLEALGGKRSNRDRARIVKDFIMYLMHHGVRFAKAQDVKRYYRFRSTIDGAGQAIAMSATLGFGYATSGGGTLYTIGESSVICEPDIEDCEKVYTALLNKNNKPSGVMFGIRTIVKMYKDDLSGIDEARAAKYAKNIQKFMNERTAEAPTTIPVANN